MYLCIYIDIDVDVRASRLGSQIRHVGVSGFGLKPWAIFWVAIVKEPYIPVLVT